VTACVVICLFDSERDHVVIKFGKPILLREASQ